MELSSNNTRDANSGIEDSVCEIVVVAPSNFDHTAEKELAVTSYGSARFHHEFG